MGKATQTHHPAARKPPGCASTATALGTTSLLRDPSKNLGMGFAWVLHYSNAKSTIVMFLHFYQPEQHLYLEGKWAGEDRRGRHCCYQQFEFKLKSSYVLPYTSYGRA